MIKMFWDPQLSVTSRDPLFTVKGSAFKSKASKTSNLEILSTSKLRSFRFEARSKTFNFHGHPICSCFLFRLLFEDFKGGSPAAAHILKNTKVLGALNYPSNWGTLKNSGSIGLVVLKD